MMRRNFLRAAGLMAAGVSFHSRSGEKVMEGKEAGRPIALDTTIGELLRRPEFDGYAEYLLPLEFRYRDDWTMRDIPRLLPYHTGVDPEASVAILNRLSERARRGEKVWIDLGREDVGLFAFPGRKGAPFVIVCPGGGFAYVGSIHEGFPYAEAFAAEGMNAFVLQYRTGSGRWACEDLADAILRVRTMADVDPDGYALAGSSAGARMAAWLGSYGTEAFGRRAAPRPAAVIMAYTGLSEWQETDPATYMIQGTRDGIAPISVTDRRMRALERAGVKVRYERINGLPHGFGLGTGTAAEGWIGRATAFWREAREENSRREERS